MAGGPIWTEEEERFLAQCVVYDIQQPETYRLFIEKFGGVRGKSAVDKGRQRPGVVHEVNRLREQGLASVPHPEGYTPPPELPEEPTDKLRLQDENRELRAKLLRAQRKGVMFDVLAEVIHEQKALPVQPQIKIARKGTEVDEDVVVMFSDAHADQSIKPEHVLGFEDLNWAVFCVRFERFIDTIIEWTHRHLPRHSFPRLWMYCLGDNIQGDIHGSTKHTQWANAMKASLAVGDVVAQGVVDLARVFRDIHMIWLPGNHPRWANKLDWRGAHENFDFLVAAQCATRLDNYVQENRVQIDAPDSYQAVAQVRGKNFLLSHGHEVKSWSGIPWYGLERRGRRTQALFAAAEEKLHYHCIGHFHTGGSLQTPAGELIMNGNWAWTDEYAFLALGAASMPIQWMFGVHEEYGVTWRLPIHVGHTDATESRYGQRILYDLAGVDRKAGGGIPIIGGDK